MCMTLYRPFFAYGSKYVRAVCFAASRDDRSRENKRSMISFAQDTSQPVCSYRLMLSPRHNTWQIFSTLSFDIRSAYAGLLPFNKVYPVHSIGIPTAIGVYICSEKLFTGQCRWNEVDLNAVDAGKCISSFGPDYPFFAKMFLNPECKTPEPTAMVCPGWANMADFQHKPEDRDIYVKLSYTTLDQTPNNCASKPENAPKTA